MLPLALENVVVTPAPGLEGDAGRLGDILNASEGLPVDPADLAPAEA